MYSSGFELMTLGLEAGALTTSLWKIHDSGSLYFLFIDNRYL